MSSRIPRARKRTMKFFIPAAVILIAVTAIAGPVHGATVPAGGGSYTDSLPPGKTGPAAKPLHRTSAVQAPIPTNDWWTSLISTCAVEPSHTGSRRMFAFPLSYRCDINGLIMGVPQPAYPSSHVIYNGYEDAPPFRQQLLIQGNNGGPVTSPLTAADARCDGYSDWTVTATWRSGSAPAQYFSALFGHGLFYTYFTFSESVDPQIVFPYSWDPGWGQMSIFDPDGNTIGSGGYTGDHIALKAALGPSHGGAVTWYGIYAPPGTVFRMNAAYPGYVVNMTLPAGKRYLSIAPIGTQDSLDDHYRNAYAFITGTRVSWAVDEAAAAVTTHFTADTAKMRDDAVSDKPVLALFPHQWKNAAGLSFLPRTFSTLRGTMKLVEGNAFTVTLPFNGILPCLPGRGSYDAGTLKSLLNADRNQAFLSAATYSHGKELSKMANLVPIASQAGDTAAFNSLKHLVRGDLEDWFTYTPGESNRFFYYDAAWGGLIGFDTEYGSQNFNDQHFHLGYFVYAAALLGLHDRDFVTRYGPMVELLIRSYASPYRNDPLFPFLRTFDPYEGHSWCSGFSADSEDGNDQESSSEAMNSWAAVYLWGLASGNDTWRDLGIWGYVTEASAIREYYFNRDHADASLSTYGSGYAHNAVGVLFGGKITSEVWWDMGSMPPTEVEWLHGIQYIPLNPSMLYLGDNPAYVRHDYETMISENGSQEENAPGWIPLIWRYQALYNPARALAKYSGSVVHDEGSSQSFLYHWIHVFNRIGTVDTSVRADCSSYAVFLKYGIRTCVCFNPSANARIVRFYGAGGSLVGSMTLDPFTMAATSDFVNYSIQRFGTHGEAAENSDLGRVVVYPNPYRPRSGGYYDRAAGMSFSRLSPGAELKIYTVAGELAWKGTDDDGDGLIVWPAANDAGKRAASGVYLYHITDGAGRKKTGKIAVIR